MKANKTDTFFKTLVDTGVIPGASVLVGKKGNIVFKKQFGFKSIVPQEEKPEDDTLYDLASLTKPLVTAFLTVYLAEREGFSLDARVNTILPGIPFDITLLHLLTHTSGLPAWFPFYLFGDNYLERFKTLKLEYKPGKRVNYSCVGYILLYYIIEKISGVSFASLAREVIFDPLGLTNTYLAAPGHFIKNAAPTENGNRYEEKMAVDWAETFENGKYRDLARMYPWRRDIIRGETHDINSHHIGGTAGNSGLFASTSDVFRLSLEFFPSSATILKKESLHYSWNNYTPFTRNHRTTGFKMNSSVPTSGGNALSGSAIGHTGFPGTSLWLDPKDETVFVILSNRIHPTFKPYNFDKVRKKIHRLLSKEI